MNFDQQVSHCLDEILNLCQSFSSLLLRKGNNDLTERELVQIENITKVRFAFDLRENSEIGKVISQTFRLLALTRSSVRHPDQLHLLKTIILEQKLNKQGLIRFVR